jgi:hypothetical protein
MGDNDYGAVMVCWLVVCILLLMGGCFGWVAHDITTLRKEYRHEQEVRR